MTTTRYVLARRPLQARASVMPLAIGRQGMAGPPGPAGPAAPQKVYFGQQFPPGVDAPAMLVQLDADGQFSDFVFLLTQPAVLQPWAYPPNISAASVSNNVATVALNVPGFQFGGARLDTAMAGGQWLAILPDISQANGATDIVWELILATDIGGSLTYQSPGFLLAWSPLAGGLLTATLPGGRAEPIYPGYRAGEPLMLAMHASGQVDLVTQTQVIANIGTAPLNAHVYLVLVLSSTDNRAHAFGVQLSNNPLMTGGIDAPAGSVPLGQGS